MDTHAAFSEQDPTLNQTLDNQDNNADFSLQSLATAQEMLYMMNVEMQLLVTPHSIRSEHVQEAITGTLKVQVDKSTWHKVCVQPYQENLLHYCNQKLVKSGYCKQKHPIKIAWSE